MDRSDLEVLVRAHQAEIYRYLRYLGADAATAEDLVQETFLTTLESRRVPEGEVDQIMSAWLRGVARNLFLRHCRKVSKGEARVSSEILESAEATWSKNFLRGGDGFDYVEALRTCLQKLPRKYHGFIDMRYREGKSRSEMAKLRKMTEDGVKSLLRRVRASLADCVKKQLAIEEAGA